LAAKFRPELQQFFFYRICFLKRQHYIDILQFFEESERSCSATFAILSDGAAIRPPALPRTSLASAHRHFISDAEKLHQELGHL
jgi:hypothetical protein